MKPFELTAKAVAVAALEAYREGRLGFQLPEDDEQAESCLYRYDTIHEGTGKHYCCAVGAALPDDVFERLREHGFQRGRDYNVVAVCNLPAGVVSRRMAEEGTVSGLQRRHDEIVSLGGSRKSAEITAFVKYLETIANT